MKTFVCKWCGNSDTPFERRVVKCVNCGEDLDGRLRGGCGGRAKDWWRHEFSQEATVKQMEMNFKSLEKQGQLRIPAGKNRPGILPDYKEFKESEGYKRLKDSQDGNLYRDEKLNKDAEETDGF